MRMIGGKAGSGLAQWIVNQLPPHRVYIEPFLGEGAVAKLKKPAQKTIVNDIDISRSAAFSFYSRIPDLTVTTGDAISLLRTIVWRGDELVYLDPPYLFETRKGGKRPYYKFEFGRIEQHKELLELATTIPARVAISGYESDLYGSYLQEWRLSTRVATVRGGGLALEHLWMNYPEPKFLHDGRFVGNGFRAREVVKRRRQRWISRWLRMNAADRSSILLAMLEEAARLDPGSSELAMAAVLITNGDFGREEIEE